ncbi:MAG: hypothetical protein K0Q91_1276 [Fibrobacteria bacterium]|jgi:hypothetical protein|nr:hypothetical protein [Fibrobacteria bacterium]
MKHTALSALLLAAGSSFAAPEEPRVTDRSISVGAFVDVGQIVRGTLVNDDGASPNDVENLFLNRDGVALTYAATVNEKLHMNIGVGGLFWKPIPEATDAATKRINFGPGISEASARYDFNDRMSIKFGFFGYKYNPDAVNLGEYLLRSEAYPTIIQTGSMGGWVWLNSNEYKSMGAQFSWTSPGGRWRHDLLLFSEFNQAPIFDFTPSYVVTGKVVKALEIGAGVSFHRWLPIVPSQESPRGPGNTYVEIENFPAYGVQDPLTLEYSPVAGEGTLKEIQNRVTTFVDSTGTPVVSQSTDANGNTIYITVAGDTLRIGKSQRLTFQAVKVMGRASLDLGVLTGLSGEAGPFKVFGEVAVLGIKNQPYYYEDITHRIPVMLGISVPTFGVLDLLSFQIEYLKSPYPDNNFQQFSNLVPHPGFPGDNPGAYADRRDAGQYEKDDLKWSAYLKKTIVSGLEVYLQVANDHFRVQDVTAQPSFMPLTQKSSDWYYMLRFQWGL